MSPAVHRSFGIAATAVVTAAIVWGFLCVGSPETRRVERMDDRRVEDLQAIVAEMRDLVWDDQERVLTRALFANLQTLSGAARRRRLSLDDPGTALPYSYRMLDEFRYELCANFDTARDDDYAVFWNHPAGRHCWTVDVRDAP